METRTKYPINGEQIKIQNFWWFFYIVEDKLVS